MIESEILGLFYVRGTYEDKKWYVVYRKHGIRFGVILDESNTAPTRPWGITGVYALDNIFKEYQLSTNPIVLSLIKRYECF